MQRPAQWPGLCSAAWRTSRERYLSSPAAERSTQREQRHFSSSQPCEIASIRRDWCELIAAPLVLLVLPRLWRRFSDVSSVIPIAGRVSTPCQGTVYLPLPTEALLAPLKGRLCYMQLHRNLRAYHISAAARASECLHLRPSLPLASLLVYLIYSSCLLIMHCASHGTPVEAKRYG